MRLIAFIVLIIVLFASLFHIGGANLTNETLGVALMVLLASLFSDLKDFNFWGLQGTRKEERELKALEGKEAISTSQLPKVSKTKLQTARKQETLVLNEDETGNLLTLSYEIERLLRIGASLLSGDLQPKRSLRKIVEMLKDEGLLTQNGADQVRSIDWLRTMIISGKAHVLDASTLEAGNRIAYDLYKQLKDWLGEPS
jgi:hypothetical protein